MEKQVVEVLVCLLEHGLPRTHKTYPKFHYKGNLNYAQLVQGC